MQSALLQSCNAVGRRLKRAINYGSNQTRSSHECRTSSLSFILFPSIKNLGTTYRLSDAFVLVRNDTGTIETQKSTSLRFKKKAICQAILLSAYSMQC